MSEQRSAKSLCLRTRGDSLFLGPQPSPHCYWWALQPFLFPHYALGGPWQLVQDHVAQLSSSFLFVLTVQPKLQDKNCHLQSRLCSLLSPYLLLAWWLLVELFFFWLSALNESTHSPLSCRLGGHLTMDQEHGAKRLLNDPSETTRWNASSPLAVFARNFSHSNANINCAFTLIRYLCFSERTWDILTSKSLCHVVKD